MSFLTTQYEDNISLVLNSQVQCVHPLDLNSVLILTPRPKNRGIHSQGLEVKLLRVFINIVEHGVVVVVVVFFFFSLI